MAKFFRRSVVRIVSYSEESLSLGLPPNEKYYVHARGRGRWIVYVGGDECRIVFRTAELQRFFRLKPYEEMYITRV